MVGVLVFGSRHESEHGGEATVDLAHDTYVPPADGVFVVAGDGRVEEYLPDAGDHVLGAQMGILLGGLGIEFWFDVLHRLVSVCLGFENSSCEATHSAIGFGTAHARSGHNSAGISIISGIWPGLAEDGGVLFKPCKVC